MNNLPGVIGKPGKFVAGEEVRGDSGGGVKAAELIGDAGWIEKSVEVAAVDQDGLRLRGDGVTAGTAIELAFLILGRLLFKRGSLPNEGFMFLLTLWAIADYFQRWWHDERTKPGET